MTVASEEEEFHGEEDWGEDVVDIELEGTE